MGNFGVGRNAEYEKMVKEKVLGVWQSHVDKYHLKVRSKELTKDSIERAFKEVPENRKWYRMGFMDAPDFSIAAKWIDEEKGIYTSHVSDSVVEYDMTRFGVSWKLDVDFEDALERIISMYSYYFRERFEKLFHVPGDMQSDLAKKVRSIIPPERGADEVVDYLIQEVGYILLPSVFLGHVFLPPMLRVEVYNASVSGYPHFSISVDQIVGHRLLV